MAPPALPRFFATTGLSVTLWATSRLWIPVARWLCATQEGFPGSSADLSTRAAPIHPGRPGECLPVASPPVSGFILVGGLATFVFLSRPNRVHLRCGSRVRPCHASPDRFLHPALAGLHVRTGNLHGELLSVHKINQAYPGVPTVREWSFSKLMQFSGEVLNHNRYWIAARDSCTLGRFPASMSLRLRV